MKKKIENKRTIFTYKISSLIPVLLRTIFQEKVSGDRCVLLWKECHAQAAEQVHFKEINTVFLIGPFCLPFLLKFLTGIFSK